MNERIVARRDILKDEKDGTGRCHPFTKTKLTNLTNLLFLYNYQATGVAKTMLLVNKS
jgi:hypothetical protein